MKVSIVISPGRFSPSDMCDVVNQKGSKPLARSSHSISFIQGKAYIFGGGEHLPRYSLCKLVISEIKKIVQ